MEKPKLNQLASYLIKVFGEKDSTSTVNEGMKVNPIVSELATWYEKVRNAMDYRDEEVVLRAALERILKRRHFYGGNGKTIASPLLRELTWARYFPDGSISESMIQEVSETIDLYLALRKKVLSLHKIPENEINKLIYQLLSSHLAYLLTPNSKKDTLAIFMFHILKKSVDITDDSEETRDAQVLIATRKAFAKDDIALLNYHLFIQYFGIPSKETIDTIAQDFMGGYAIIKQQLHYSLRHRIFGFVKRNTPPFFILEEVLRRNKESLMSIVGDEEKLRESVYEVCKEKYQNIRSKVNRAIVRSIIFVLLTKTFIALAIEGTAENLLYGEVAWMSIILNIIIPPILLAIASLFIRTPDTENTEKIYRRIHALLYNPDPHVSGSITLRKQSKTTKSFMYTLFSFLWLAAFFASFGLVVFILTKLHFNPISQAIFLFYLAIIAFLIYRIYQTAHLYTIEKKQHLLTPIVDFFFMPIARVGRHLTESVSQVNIFLFILDFFIEAPFKGAFSFFEQWFMFMHSKREYLDS